MYSLINTGFGIACGLSFYASKPISEWGLRPELDMWYIAFMRFTRRVRLKPELICSIQYSFSVFNA